MRGLGERSSPRGLKERIRAAWPQAIARWSSFLVLEPPGLDARQPSLAQIDLRTRRVSLNDRLITQLKLEECIPAMLAHELGHHVSYPGTLQVQARLKLLERTLLPDPACSVTNHFTDFMINERLGATELRGQMIRIYQAGLRNEAGSLDFFSAFYLALYEALWDLKEGEILGPAAVRELTGELPMYRAEAQVLAQDLFLLGPNIYTQFLYFLSVALRYLVRDMKRRHHIAQVAALAGAGGGCRCGEPSDADWGQAITPGQAEKEAVERARERGWFDVAQSQRLGRALTVDERIAGLPGADSRDASPVPPIMASFYRQQAERLLFRPPAQRRMGEAVVPAVLEEWTPGDPVRDIDWPATWRTFGHEIGAALPLKRLYEAEHEGEDVRYLQPRMEIYLDVSGSMPNPCLAMNPMTLAAQILTSATLRARGQVRLALYSHETLKCWEWSRSERDLSGFLMRYIGGGTQFPFRLLAASVLEEAASPPIRVIITDHDFDTNFATEPGAAALLAEAARPPGMILLKAGGEDLMHIAYRRAGMRVVPVGQRDSYPQVARELAWALFPEEGA